LAFLTTRNRPLLRDAGVMQSTTQNVSPADHETEDKEANLPNRRYRRVLRNLKVGIDLPYNLHMLQLTTMQEKTLVRLVNL